MTSTTIDTDEQLQLKDLQKWVTPDIYEWLKEGDVEADKLKEEMEEQGTDAVTNLFSNDDDSSSSHNDDFEGVYGRIRYWSSSKTNPNGVGHGHGESEPTDDVEDADETKKTVAYVISESFDGYGDILWSSARYLANQFSDPIKCRELLSPRYCGDTTSGHCVHPLRGLRVLELGAGAGVPSYMAMHCGAQVVCSDLDSPNRIRSIAESMERNYRSIVTKQNNPKGEKDAAGDDDDDDYYHYTKLSRACPLKWGQPVDQVVESLNGGSDDSSDINTKNEELSNDQSAESKRPQRLFDVIFAADCCYMPWLHVDLLNTIDKLLIPLPSDGEATGDSNVNGTGVAVLTFAIHEGISKEEEVWTILDRIKEQGKFDVETLESIQLKPPRTGMLAKQGFVSTIRLTRKKK